MTLICTIQVYTCLVGGMNFVYTKSIEGKRIAQTPYHYYVDFRNSPDLEGLCPRLRTTMVLKKKQCYKKRKK